MLIILKKDVFRVMIAVNYQFNNIKYLINQCMIVLDRYQLIKGFGQHTISVGFGSYGQVKLAIDKKTGKKVAVKIVNKKAQSQVDYHHQLYHPNIIQLLGYDIDFQRQITYMVLQFADGGTLFDKIRNEKLSKKQIKSYFKDVCDAVAYMHQKQIMHRDIKPQNILLTTNGKAKLCDFGFAAVLGERKTLCGTYEYMSPEMVQGRPYDYKIDIWALGILLFELISGKAPFKGNSPQEVLDQMKTKIFFNQRFLTQEVNLIKSILRVTPSKRPSIKQILEHPYFLQQDTTSTKQSQIQTKQSKFDQTQKICVNTQFAQHSMNKTQQNSYPSYVPKVKQPAKVEKGGQKIALTEVVHKQQNINTNVTMPYSSGMIPYQMPYSKGGFQQKPNTTLNNSFTNVNQTPYRKS